MTWNPSENVYSFLSVHMYMLISIIVIVWQVCKLFRHIATNEQLVIAAEHNEFVLKNLGPLVSGHNF